MVIITKLNLQNKNRFTQVIESSLIVAISVITSLDKVATSTTVQSIIVTVHNDKMINNNANIIIIIILDSQQKLINSLCSSGVCVW